MMEESQQMDPCRTRSTEEPLPVCCGTGCVVCVLDYPELYPSPVQSTDSETLAMLEAFEQAEAEAAEKDNKR